MSSDNDEALNVLLTKVMKDRYCHRQASDNEACIANFVPLNGDGSFVEQSLQRRGKKVCDPYMNELQKCMHDEKKQQAVMKHASTVPECKAERASYMKCQKMGASGGSGEGCEREAREMLLCGLAYTVQRSKQKRGGSGQSQSQQGVLQTE